MRIASSTLVAMALVALSGAALADLPAGPAVGSSEQFLVKAMQASLAEVELGKLAQKNAQSTGVNALGVRLQRDHTRIGKVLAATSRDKGVEAPTSLDNSQRAQVEALAAKKGQEFDNAYIELMVSNHQDVIAMYTAVAESGDKDVSQLAKMALPTLREDHRLAGSYDSGYALPTVAARR